MDYATKITYLLPGLAGSLLTSVFNNNMTQPVLSVSVTVIGGAALGAYAAIGFDDVVRPRKKLFFMGSSTIIISCALVGVLPSYFGWAWFNDGIQGGMAILCSVVTYFGLPEAVPTFRRLIRNFKISDLPFFRKFASHTPPPDPATIDPPTSEGEEK